MGLNTNENLKHRQGVAGKPKYQCPKCKNGLSIGKKAFMVVCSKCKNVIMQEDIITN